MPSHIEQVIRLIDDEIDSAGGSSTPGTVKVLLHESYGGEGLPDWLFEEYGKRNPDQRLTLQHIRLLLRYDPIAIQIFRDAADGKLELPTVFSSRGPKPREDVWRLECIPEIWKDYIQIREYDGKESLYIDYGNILHQLVSCRARDHPVCREILDEYNQILGRNSIQDTQQPRQGLDDE